ncbi:Peptidyl-prolyl cis-trans isomerase FKBP17-1, chloroplastic [Zostera marina]|uniref:peptidylprolyl isomerase n=1 Tax=Zostera marina TaxID=29655 RepID=A0A0K9Q1I9_ZOSMR|nr:Peptidyl-prolyl cis-trans isomerase FKBP17-1, chloroplastic [Zostera marina]
MQSFSTTSASPSKLLRLISFSSKPPQFLKTQIDHSSPLSSPSLARRSLLISTLFLPHPVASKAADVFYEIEGSGGVKVLELRVGGGASPTHGDKVAIHYYGRLAAKQGWRFDSTYDHKDSTGVPIPFVFTIGSSDNVISGIQIAVKSMRVGGIRRVIIPPSQGYQTTSQQPLPPNFFDRQRLFTTIFNPTRIANGESSTLATLVFDIELISARRP